MVLRQIQKCLSAVAESDSQESATEVVVNSYQDLLQKLVNIRDDRYRNDRERNQARLDAVEEILRSLLEKLRNEFEPFEQ